MKKLLVLVALLAIASSSFAQVKFGAKAGINIANLKITEVDYDPGLEYKVGLTIGAFAKYSVSEKFAIQPELLYSMKGAKINYSEGNDYNKGSIKTNYLSIPIIAKYYLSSGFNLQAGPQMDFLLSAKTSYDSSIDGHITSESYDFKDSLKGIDFGLAVGLGYDLENGLGIEARYILGLSELNKNTEEDGSAKSKGFQITASYAF
ncbi:porin family protein [Carboxylicivirga sp. N1Y90]|uniref:porin family protein n=1 Tax=Carboxylicivirga fragile TaxID=3417571 RepID=UPI003D354B4A|nr:PorT family protein [Marinilabiliaceae bacterium N1Y90]